MSSKEITGKTTDLALLDCPEDDSTDLVLSDNQKEVNADVPKSNLSNKNAKSNNKDAIEKNVDSIIKYVNNNNYDIATKAIIKLIEKYGLKKLLSNYEKSIDELKSVLISFMKSELKKDNYNDAENLADAYLALDEKNENALLVKFLATKRVRSIPQLSYLSKSFAKDIAYKNLIAVCSEETSKQLKKMLSKIKKRNFSDGFCDAFLPHFIGALVCLLIVGGITVFVLGSVLYFRSDNFLYKTEDIDNETIAIVKIRAPKRLTQDGVMTIPNEVKGKTVGEIRQKAVKRYRKVTTLYINCNSAQINEHAVFKCRNLQTVVIGTDSAGTTSIEEKAFFKCKKLKSIITKDSVRVIKGCLVEKCNKYDNLVVGNGVINLGSYLFPNDYDHNAPAYTRYNGDVYIGNETNPHYALVYSYGFSKTHPDTKLIARNSIQPGYSINFSDGLIAISDYISTGDFINNGTIYIPETVEYIGRGAFMGFNRTERITVSKENKFFKDVDGILFSSDGTQLIRFPDYKNVTEYDMPDDVRQIGMGAFSGQRYMSYISLSDNLEYIEEDAFFFCKNLFEINIGKNVKKIGPCAFADCENLIRVNLENCLEEIGRSSFSYSGIKEITIPESVKIIRDSAFSSCHNLNKVTFLGNNLETIEDSAFYCTNLKTITIPSSVINIGKYVFGGDSELTVYTELEKRPKKWNKRWVGKNCSVVWGYKN